MYLPPQDHRETRERTVSAEGGGTGKEVIGRPLGAPWPVTVSSSGGGGVRHGDPPPGQSAQEPVVCVLGLNIKTPCGYF